MKTFMKMLLYFITVIFLMFVIGFVVELYKTFGLLGVILFLTFTSMSLLLDSYEGL